MNRLVRQLIESPIGRLRITWDGSALLSIETEPQIDRASCAPRLADWSEDAPVIEQLREYFSGERRRFELRTAPRGTAFQQRVWSELARIPFGETRSYSEIARRIGRPRAGRAVGAACARNPIAIVVPCHRVVAASGALTGYAGGLEAKARLLAHEGVAPTSCARRGTVGSRSAVPASARSLGRSRRPAPRAPR